MGVKIEILSALGGLIEPSKKRIIASGFMVNPLAFMRVKASGFPFGFTLSGGKHMKELISSAGLLHLYLNGYEEGWNAKRNRSTHTTI